jgi:hypothetical protein
MPVLRDILIGAALASALAPASARAGDLGLPRTEMIHQGEVCLTRVDRSVDPVVHLDYTIPSVDVCLTGDEPPDSRTHQFVAFCRDALPHTLPPWITWDDVDASLAADPEIPEPVTSDQVLEDSPRFAGCWWPILRADERRPITCAAARPGVDWDTTGLAPGAYVVAGYTYMPWLNRWRSRRGVYRVHDGDPDAAPPAAAIFTREADVWSEQPIRLGACVDAPPGSTWRLDLAVMPDAPEPELDWQPFLPAAPVDGGELDIRFTLPPERAGTRLTARLVVEDPQARVAVAHMPAPGTILMRTQPDPTGGGGSSDDDDSGGDGFDFCRDNPRADDPPKCAAESPADEPHRACACRSEAPGAGALLPCLVLLARRRRR